MLYRVRTKVTYANVMSTIAVFFAIGGGAVYAAGKINTGDIQRNAITAGLVKKDAIRGSEIKRNAIGSAEIKKNAIKGSDIRPGAITDADIRGSLPIATTIRTEAFTLVPESLEAVINLECGAGETPVGGGYRIEAGAAQTLVSQTAPALVGGDTVWQLEMSTPAGGTYTGFVNCMETSG